MDSTRQQQPLLGRAGTIALAAGGAASSQPRRIEPRYIRGHRRGLASLEARDAAQYPESRDRPQVRVCDGFDHTAGGRGIRTIERQFDRPTRVAQAREQCVVVAVVCFDAFPENGTSELERERIGFERA